MNQSGVRGPTAPQGDGGGDSGACLLCGREAFVGYLCRRHYHWLDRTLAQIEELAALMPDTLLPGPGGDVRGGTRVGSPSPGRLLHMALTDRRAKTPVDLEPDEIPDMPGTLASWAQVVTEERGTSDPIGTMTQTVKLLRKERHWIARQPWVDDYAAELGSVHRWLASAVGDTMWPRPIGACPNCGANLYNTIGLDEVTCGRCKQRWTGVDLARLRLIHEQEQSA